MTSKIAISAWRSLDTAPRALDGSGEPIKVLLFLPGFHYETDSKGKPTGNMAHGECIGYWAAQRSAWVESESGDAVYASLWKPIDA
jgi:hypothetical protein